MIEAGHLNAIAFWFDLHLDDEISITTAPARIGLGGEVIDDSSAAAAAASGSGSGTANPVGAKGRVALQNLGRDPAGSSSCSATENFTPAEVLISC